MLSPFKKSGKTTEFFRSLLSSHLRTFNFSTRLLFLHFINHQNLNHLMTIHLIHRLMNEQLDVLYEDIVYQSL